MELVLGVAIFLLAAAGLAIGLILGRGPIEGSCGGLACIKGASCAGCRSRAGKEAEEAP